MPHRHTKYIGAILLFCFVMQGACTPSADKEKGFSEIETAFQQKNYSQTLNLADAFIQKNPDSLPAQRLKIQAMLALDDIPGALAEHEILLKTQPKIALQLLHEIIIGIFKQSLQNENFFVRSAAIKAIGEMGDPALIPLIIPSMRDPATFVRFFSVEAIGQLEGPDLLKLVMAAGQDPDGMVRVAAVKVLAALDATQNGLQVNNLLATFTTDADATVRLLAMAAMSKNGDPAAFERISTAIETLPANDLSSAIAALGQSRHPDAVPFLLKYITDSNDMLRMFAAEAMGVIADQKFYPALINTLGDKAPSVKGSAATSLGKLGDKKAIPDIKKLLDDPNAMVRISAAEGLKRLGEARIDLYQTALSHKDYGVRHFTIGSLRRNWEKDGLPLLKAALKDEAPRVRTAAIRAIGEVGGPENLSLLKALMKDKDLAVRTYAAGNVGRLINKMAGRVLKKSAH